MTLTLRLIGGTVARGSSLRTLEHRAIVDLSEYARTRAVE